MYTVYGTIFCCTMSSDGVPGSPRGTAARLKNTISTIPHHTPNGTNSSAPNSSTNGAIGDTGETRETEYLRSLNINAKDVYEIARAHPDLSWQRMTQWGENGGDLVGVLVKRLRCIPTQAAEAQRKAEQRKEAEAERARQAEDEARAENRRVLALGEELYERWPEDRQRQFDNRLETSLASQTDAETGMPVLPNGAKQWKGLACRPVLTVRGT